MSAEMQAVYDNYVRGSSSIFLPSLTRDIGYNQQMPWHLATGTSYSSRKTFAMAKSAATASTTWFITPIEQFGGKRVAVYRTSAAWAGGGTTVPAMAGLSSATAGLDEPFTASGLGDSSVGTVTRYVRMIVSNTGNILHRQGVLFSFVYRGTPAGLTEAQYTGLPSYREYAAQTLDEGSRVIFLPQPRGTINESVADAAANHDTWFVIGARDLETTEVASFTVSLETEVAYVGTGVPPDTRFSVNPQVASCVRSCISVVCGPSFSYLDADASKMGEEFKRTARTVAQMSAPAVSPQSGWMNTIAQGFSSFEATARSVASISAAVAGLL